MKVYNGVEQSEEKRRNIRRKYREIQKCFEEVKDDLQKPGHEGLNEKIDQCEDVFKSVVEPREAILDSALVAQMSHTAMKQAQALDTDFTAFDVTDFCQKLVSFIGEESGNTRKTTDLSGDEITAKGWRDFGLEVMPFLNKAPIWRVMRGALSKEVPESQRRQRRAPVEKEQVVTAKSVEEVDQKSVANAESTTQIVASINKVLEEECSDDNAICFYEFVINPDSYSQTIENIFFTSFLLRDGLAELTLDDDDLPALKKGRNSETQTGAKSKETTQMVMEMSVQMWQAIIGVYNIQSPMIPTRPS